MSFWIRSAVFAILLIGLAIAFFLNKELLLGPEPNANPKVEIIHTPAEYSQPDQQPKQKKNKKPNAAAEGLSNFYAKVYGDNDKRRIINNVIYLPEHKGDLIETLKARELIVRPFPKNWAGPKVSRVFRQGETLYQKLAEYSAQEGLEVIWWINKDFIIKDAFRIEKNIMQTARQIGNAVAGHFPNGINSYFCYRQRTIVLVNEPLTYLNEECVLL